MMRFRAQLLSLPVMTLVFAVLLHLNARLSPARSLAAGGFVAALTAAACTLVPQVCRYLPLRTTRSGRLVTTHALIAMWLSGIVVALAHAGAAGPQFMLAAPALTVIVALIYVLATSLQYLQQSLQLSTEAESESKEARLAALKAQINPHFLFNSLNSISALTTADGKRARDMCVKLSDFLRTTLRVGEAASVPFQTELALTQTYLDVEKVRFGDRLKVSWTIDESWGDCSVPPLLLQPLIENAVRHGIASLPEGGVIEIAGSKVKDSIQLTVRNPFDPDAPSIVKTGFGLNNVRRRIEARWGAAATMKLSVDRQTYTAVLQFPYEKGRA